jgi:predicted PurR-regulated permease PerM
MLLLLVPLVGGVRDLLQDLPTIVADLRESDELAWLGDSGAAENVQSGAEEASLSIPDAISAVLGIAGDFFSIFLAAFTILFICLFLLTDVTNLKRSLASVLMPGEDERWLGVWERVTESISRWAIGVIVIATIAGTLQGTTAWLLGSSYALALGVIAGLLDMIPNIGATIAGFVLVPTLWAEEGLTAALIMLVVILVYQQLENNILTPKIQGKAVRLSGFFIIVAVTLFGALLGVLGALTAVPLAATLQIFVQELTKARRERVAAATAALAAPSEPA